VNDWLQVMANQAPSVHFLDCSLQFLVPGPTSEIEISSMLMRDFFHLTPKVCLRVCCVCVCVCVCGTPATPTACSGPHPPTPCFAEGRALDPRKPRLRRCPMRHATPTRAGPPTLSLRQLVSRRPSVAPVA
jgi:hypothetical protein